MRDPVDPAHTQTQAMVQIPEDDVQEMVRHADALLEAHGDLKIRLHALLAALLSERDALPSERGAQP